MCGVRGTKGPKQRPSVDPELALFDLPTNSPSRKLNNKGKKKTKRKEIAKANKKSKRLKNKNGLVKREAFPQVSDPSRLKNGKKKRDRRKKVGKAKGKKKNRKRKKTRRKGKSRQGESGESDESDVRTRQVWPWMVGSSFACNLHPNQIIM